jgi:hypothetical protein
MLNLPVHGPTRPKPAPPLLQAALYAENRSARTLTTYSSSCGRPTPSAPPQHEPGGRCPGRPRGVHGRLAGLADGQHRRHRHKVLKILYGWLAEEEEIPVNPMAK